MLPLLAWILVSCLSTNNPAETYTILKGSNITKPGCPSKCGNLTVGYPFGIGSGCGINEWFEFVCTDASFGPPQPLLKGTEVSYVSYNRSFQVSGISDGRVRVSSILLTTEQAKSTRQATTCPISSALPTPTRISTSS